MKREKRYSWGYERSRDCPLLQRKCTRTSWSQCNISWKRWRKGGTISCLSARRCKRGHKRYKTSKTRENIQKESLAAREEMRKIREEIVWKEKHFTLLADKVDKNTMADAEMGAELQGLQAGEERRGSNASQAFECCLETMVEQIFAMGTDQARSKFDAICQNFLQQILDLRRSGANARKRRRTEETVKMNKSKAEPVSSWCHSCQAVSIKLHQRAVFEL